MQNKDQEKKSECKIWAGFINKQGYGVITYRRKQFRVHQLAVLLSGRNYPKGMVTDHLCRNRACYNPDHLEVVTNGENVMRGESFAPKNKAMTNCTLGHPLNGTSRRQKSGTVWRFCRECQNNKRNKKRREQRINRQGR